jgi:hypothetical protein
LKKALVLSGATHEGIGQACKVLQFEVKGVINRYPWLPVPIPPAWLATGILIAAAAIVHVVVSWSQATAVPLAITNIGCDTIRLNSPAISFPWLELPQLVEKDKTETATMPLMFRTIDIDATANG